MKADSGESPAASPLRAFAKLLKRRAKLTDEEHGWLMPCISSAHLACLTRRTNEWF